MSSPENTTVGGGSGSGGSFNISSPTGTQLKEYKFDSSVEGWTAIAGSSGVCTHSGSSLILTSALGLEALADDPAGIINADVEIWADYREVLADSSTTAGNAGIAFRVQDASNYYLMHMIQTPTSAITFTLHKRVAGTYTTIATTTVTSLSKVYLDDLYSNIILIRNLGSVIEIFFNNTLLFFELDSTFLATVLPPCLYAADSADIRVDTMRIYSVTIPPNRIPVT